jgi:hypothetical protein
VAERSLKISQIVKKCKILCAPRALICAHSLKCLHLFPNWGGETRAYFGSALLNKNIQGKSTQGMSASLHIIGTLNFPTTISHGTVFSIPMYSLWGAHTLGTFPLNLFTF